MIERGISAGLHKTFMFVNIQKTKCSTVKSDAAFFLVSSASRMIQDKRIFRACVQNEYTHPANDSPTRSELTLPSCFRLLLALYGRLFIMFTLANLSDHAVFCAGTLETLQSSVQGLVLTNAYFCHEFFPPFVLRQRLSIKRHLLIDAPYKLNLNTRILYHSLYVLSSSFCMRV